MKIRFLNCATMYPRGAGLFVPLLDRVPSICMLIEAKDRLVLIDTGFGTRDMADTSRLGLGDIVLNTQADPRQPAVRQIERMGYDPRDVRDIVCTHLDRDHAGGLSDFPEARVHVLAAELDAALRPKALSERERYRACHFSHGPRWVAHEAVLEEKWFGLECMQQVPGLPPGFVLVPLLGHTRGHCGVAVHIEEGWVLHCGDAYYVKEELRSRGGVPLGVRAFRRVAHVRPRMALRQLDKLRRLMVEHAGEVMLVASHDQFEYRNIFGKVLD